MEFADDTAFEWLVLDRAMPLRPTSGYVPQHGDGSMIPDAPGAWLTIHPRLLAVARTATADVVAWAAARPVGLGSFKFVTGVGR
jgi:hypothetical protein